jgi:hypothetical protein
MRNDGCDPNRRRRAVCRRCHMVMDDCEPMARDGEFNHAAVHRDGTKSRCPNAGQAFYLDRHAKEIEPFEPKRVRRAAKRAGIRN